MEKLTLEHIAYYYPHKLCIIHNNDGVVRRVQYLNSASIEVQPQKHGYKHMSIEQWHNEKDNFKLCLLPMDLTKPIIVEGKEIIPYHELCKIACNIQELSEDVSYNENDRQLEVIGKRGYKLIFAFDSNDNSFIIMSNGVTKCVSNQLTLFQWLFKHKFDVFGLIPAGLAIDVNTLETNPYN